MAAGVGSTRSPGHLPAVTDRQLDRPVDEPYGLTEEEPVASPHPRLRPVQQIRRPRRRGVEQIIVHAERERGHLVEERLLARMDVARIGAAEAGAAGIMSRRLAVS